MTFVEIFGQLGSAAEQYAGAVESLDPARIRETEAALLDAAIQFAAWGKK